MKARIMKRIKVEVNDWDLTNKVFQKIHDTMVDTFKRHFHYITLELKNIETNFTSDETMPIIIDKRIEDSDELQDPDFTRNEKLLIGFTAPIWVPVSIVVGLVALPVVGIKALRKKRKEAKQLKEMKANLEHHMEELTASILDEMIASTTLEKALKHKVDELNNAFCNLLDNVPRFIKADHKILDHMELEFKDKAKHFVTTYKSVYSDIDELTGEISTCVPSGRMTSTTIR